MKKVISLFLVTGLFCLVQSSVVQAAVHNPMAVYGSDNRIDLFKVTNPVYLKAASSSAALVASARLTATDTDGNVKIYSLLYGTTNNLCTDEPFYHQPMGANCSGFLVGPDLIATAGHCMSTQDYCTKYNWVFDFAVKSDTQTQVSVPPSSIYKCKEIVAHVEDSANETDFALVRLDRPVVGHTPIPIHRNSNATYGTKVVLAGYPSGLPLKLSEGTVTDLDAHLYWTNVDSFIINSGSLIFNAQSGQAEGILVAGAHDYTLDSATGTCFRSFVLNPAGGQERVTKISVLQPYL